MKLPIRLALTILIATWWTSPRDLRPMDRREGRVIKVVDGDTYDVAFVTIERVRLADVDTKESRNVRRKGADPDAEEIKAGRVITRATEEKLLNKSVIVEVSPPGRRDSFGRLLGKVYIDGDDVSDWIRASGFERPP